MTDIELTAAQREQLAKQDLLITSLREANKQAALALTPKLCMDKASAVDTVLNVAKKLLPDGALNDSYKHFTVLASSGRASRPSPVLPKATGQAWASVDAQINTFEAQQRRAYAKNVRGRSVTDHANNGRSETDPLPLVECKRCKKVLLRGHFSRHFARCRIAFGIDKSNQVIAGGVNSGTKRMVNGDVKGTTSNARGGVSANTNKGRSGSPAIGPASKKARMSPAKMTARNTKSPSQFPRTIVHNTTDDSVRPPSALANTSRSSVSSNAYQSNNNNSKTSSSSTPLAPPPIQRPSSTHSDSPSVPPSSPSTSKMPEHLVNKRHPNGAPNFDRVCGVKDVQKDSVCMRSLTCKYHNLSLKRAVQGRTSAFDTLLSRHLALSRQRAKKPDTPTGNETGNGKRSSTDTNGLFDNDSSAAYSKSLVTQDGGFDPQAASAIGQEVPPPDPHRGSLDEIALDVDDGNGTDVDVDAEVGVVGEVKKGSVNNLKDLDRHSRHEMSLSPSSNPYALRPELPAMTGYARPLAVRHYALRKTKYLTRSSDLLYADRVSRSVHVPAPPFSPSYLDLYQSENGLVQEAEESPRISTTGETHPLGKRGASTLAGGGSATAKGASANTSSNVTTNGKATTSRSKPAVRRRASSTLSTPSTSSRGGSAAANGTGGTTGAAKGKGNSQSGGKSGTNASTAKVTSGTNAGTTTAANARSTASKASVESAASTGARSANRPGAAHTTTPGLASANAQLLRHPTTANATGANGTSSAGTAGLRNGAMPRFNPSKVAWVNTPQGNAGAKANDSLNRQAAFRPLSAGSVRDGRDGGTGTQ